MPVLRPRFRPLRGLVMLAAGLLGALAVVVPALPAAAHVSVGSPDARRGAAEALLTFRVPSERSGTTTVGVTIRMPTRSPLASVVPQAPQGWTVETTTATLPQPIRTVDGDVTKAVTQVSFRASTPQAGIADDRFGTFQLLVGPIPADVDRLAFPTVQTYANGDTSAWIEAVADGVSEPDHPAPTLALAPADAGGAAGRAPAVAPPADAQDGVARLAGIVGVVLGAAGLLLAGFALGRTRRRVLPDAAERGALGPRGSGVTGSSGTSDPSGPARPIG